MRQQRDRRIDAEALAKRIALQDVERKSGRKPPFALFAHRTRMPGPARVVEALRAPVIAARHVARDVADRVDRRFARFQHRDGLAFAVAFRNADETGIDFVL